MQVLTVQTRAVFERPIHFHVGYPGLLANVEAMEVFQLVQSVGGPDENLLTSPSHVAVLRRLSQLATQSVLGSQRPLQAPPATAANTDTTAVVLSAFEVI